MIENDDTNRWNAKHDCFRSTTDFTDLLKIVAGFHDMYARTVAFTGPYVSKQSGSNIFIPPDKEQIKMVLGKERPTIPFRSRNAFIDGVISFLQKTKGRKALLTPNASTHHSAQFPQGTFAITALPSATMVMTRDDKGARKPAKTMHAILFDGAELPVFVENLMIPPDQIKFVIVRPKLGKLGTPSVNRWEVLLYKKGHGYLVEHCDSDLNPRWSGLLN